MQKISYDYLLKHWIQHVSPNNYFMNYGYWKKSNTLKQANTSLVRYILKKSRCHLKKNMRILDVGCGYGAQDFYWIQKLHPTTNLTAIDISTTSIQYAQQKYSHPRIQFQTGDAMKIAHHFHNMDLIFSVESAFHYSNRNDFFNQVRKVLAPNGTFIIGDIVIRDSSLCTYAMILFFKKLLNIPYNNLVNAGTWENNIRNAGLTIVESKDITDFTFIPYYNYFFDQLGSTMLKYIFTTVQPFSYRIAVCKKN